MEWIECWSHGYSYWICHYASAICRKNSRSSRDYVSMEWTKWKRKYHTRRARHHVYETESHYESKRYKERINSRDSMINCYTKGCPNNPSPYAICKECSRASIREFFWKTLKENWFLIIYLQSPKGLQGRLQKYIFKFFSLFILF